MNLLANIGPDEDEDEDEEYIIDLKIRRGLESVTSSRPFGAYFF